jgi:anti-sigma regulatory factor (Ser/Thr protein kinase)
MASALAIPVDHRGGRSFHWRFACHPSSAGKSRLAVDTLIEQVQRPLLDDVRLLVSELVANSVRHGPRSDGWPIRLRLWVSAGVVQAEVRDDGHGFGSVPIPTTESDSGRGLFLVDRLADRWGMSDEPGTGVWFEIER